MDFEKQMQDMNSIKDSLIEDLQAKIDENTKELEDKTTLIET